jgi:transcriptional regulator with XRE-family HTH domain
MSSTEPVGLGPLLKEWRQRRHLSQLELASQAGVSSRHLSFVETGRSRPSRELVLHLAEHLDVPLRERNALLLAAGYAPEYQERRIDSPDMQAARDALDALLRSHEPYPAIVADRLWNLVSSNAAAWVFVEGVAPELVEPPMNVLRLTMHPEGLAPRIQNFTELTAHLLTRLKRQVHLTGDQAAADLYDELSRYPNVATDLVATEIEGPSAVVTPVRFRARDRDLSLFSTIATFGTAIDITLAEIVIESFFPADEQTAAALREWGGVATA